MNANNTTEAVKGDATGYGIIHEEYVEREAESRCFKRHEISVEQWRKMTSPEEMRFWKARGVIRTYTQFGYMVIGHSRRRWGDNLKVLDRFHIAKKGTKYIAIDKDIDEMAA